MFNNTIPSYMPMGQSQPYASAQSPQMPSPMGIATSAYKKGGMVKKKKKLTPAHMSRAELDVMDLLQGGTERHNQSGARSYSHLEELLSNPHLMKKIYHHASMAQHHEHHANGGLTGLTKNKVDQMKANGIHGDHEVALIGPHTHHFLNSFADHASLNPQDGHPQYFNLGNFFKGIGNTIVHGVQTAGNAISNGLNQVGNYVKPVINGIGQAKSFMDKTGITPMLEAGATAIAPEIAIPAIAAANTANYLNKGKQAYGAFQHLVG
jgi:hypothetical protein